MKIRFITIDNPFRNGCYLVYFLEHLCTVVSGIRFETTMDDHIVGWMILISPKNNERMLFGGMQYICSRYVTGRQQQGRRRLEEEG